MTTAEEREVMYTTAKLAEALGITESKVKRLIVSMNIHPDQVKRGSRYYGPATLGKLKAGMNKQ